MPSCRGVELTRDDGGDVAVSSFIYAAVDGRETDFPARRVFPLPWSQLIRGWQAQDLTKLDPLSASQCHLFLHRIAKHYLWDEHPQSQIAIGQFEEEDGILESGN